MSEHECEWIAMTLREPISQRGQFFFKCSRHDCPYLLTAPQVATRLNEYDKLKAATERLSAEHARYFADNTIMIALRDYLRAYADTLEGK